STGVDHRPRRSAGALQPDALLSGHRQCGGRRTRAEAVRSLQGGRVGAVHHRTVPAPLAGRQQRAPVDPRASIGGGDPAMIGKGVVAALACAVLVSASAPSPIVFADVTASAGVRFVHHNGAFGKKYLPETLGSGCVFLDIDDDGWQDILMVDSTSWPGHAGAKSQTKLYRNKGDGTFADVTAGSGLDVELYGMGAAAADYDNDGRVDIFITTYGSNRLFHNAQHGKIPNVHASVRLAGDRISTSPPWLLYL